MSTEAIDAASSEAPARSLPARLPSGRRPAPRRVPRTASSNAAMMRRADSICCAVGERFVDRHGLLRVDAVLALKPMPRAYCASAVSPAMSPRPSRRRRGGTARAQRRRGPGPARVLELAALRRARHSEVETVVLAAQRQAGDARRRHRDLFAAQDGLRRLDLREQQHGAGPHAGLHLALANHHVSSRMCAAAWAWEAQAVKWHDRRREVVGGQPRVEALTRTCTVLPASSAS